MAVEDVGGIAVAPREDAEGDGEAVSEDGGVGEASIGKIGEGLAGVDEDLVFGVPLVEGLGDGTLRGRLRPLDRWFRRGFRRRFRRLAHGMGRAGAFRCLPGSERDIRHRESPG